MKDFLLDAFNALSDEDFEERPVEIEEFVTSPDFLNLPRLSEIQYQMVRAASQIYKEHTLISLYGEEKGRQRFNETYNEIILQIGKGAGKDYTMSIAMVYIVYLLICLKDPSLYYGEVPGNHIDLINIAINGEQAKNVFFKYVKAHLKRCAWFEDRYKITPVSVEFDKSITLYSGHSEREAFEGLNLFMAVLDEISGFALESNTGNDRANTAQATYDTYRDSVDSRFEEFGKVIMLSFPRFEDDFIQQKYKAAIKEMDTILRSYTFKIEPDLPDGTEGNELTITWEEDHIIRYARPRVWALRRPSWDVRPDRDIESYKTSFFNNKGNALGKFACMPSNLETGFFKNIEAIEAVFSGKNGVDEDGNYMPWFKPQRGVDYYIHVDLAQLHDHCAVAMAHCEKWVNVDIGNATGEPYPYIVVDCVRWWTPTKEKSVDFADVRAFIVSLKRKGFNVVLTTFDRWNSHDTMKYLTEQHGMETEKLSVALPHYQDFQTIMYDYRMDGPDIKLLKTELGQLMLIKGKVEHPRSGSKDLSDAVCGAVFNAAAYAEKPEDSEVEVLTYADIRGKVHEDSLPGKDNPGVIIAPKGNRPMPDEIQDFLAGLRIL